MATTYTTNYNLGKQENHADKFDMDVITDNADKIDAALTGLQSSIDGKQDALSSEQLAAVNSGITSTDVEQIETNKNNILTVADQTIKYNVCSANSWGTTSTGASPKQIVAPIPTGTYRIIATVSRTDTSKAIQFRIGYTTEMSVGNRVDILPAVETENYISNEFTLTSSGVCVDFWANTPSDITQFAIIPKAIYDAGFTNYQPYAMSNTELTNKEQVNENNISYIADKGAKNLLRITATSQTTQGVTFTMNADGTITANGTVTSGVYSATIDIGTFLYEPGMHIELHGTPTGGGSSSYRMYVVGKSTADWFDDGNGATFPPVSSPEQLTIRIAIYKQYTANNTTFKPMLCTSEDYAISSEFVPYAMSNADITAWILAHS